MRLFAYFLKDNGHTLYKSNQMLDVCDRKCTHVELIPMQILLSITALQANRKMGN